MARTGSGKTASFLIPMLQKLQEKENSNKSVKAPKALIMSPTRELAIQTFKFTKMVSSVFFLNRAIQKDKKFEFMGFPLFSWPNIPISKQP